ncbi:hypothetical protein AC791_10805 [Klebsiella sp. RIT-PI-d]|uniref:hypothetical protein n=1 Tax=Klebsiella sp. RIT-PI-d TaxID=1681196 RepID=UPI000675F968|nr:hypothetical protein [Klebsiella sp. RIT-PI-d]KNC09151.1 hypothetical protein AC791_10805 [Klebsiella sp. RIT-PI-d]
MDNKYILVAALLFISTVAQATQNENIQHQLFRRATLQETTWLNQQADLHSVHCADLFVASDISTTTAYSLAPVVMTFSSRPLFVQGRMTCQLTLSRNTPGSLELFAREDGYLGNAQYTLTHTGVNADGYISKGVEGWHFSCETRENVNEQEADFHGCFINDDNFYIQKVPELTALEVPEGYLISVGKMRFNPISQLRIGKSEFITAADFPFIYGDNAAQAIANLEGDKRVSWSWGDLRSRQIRTRTLSPQIATLARPAVKVLDRAWASYQ